MNINPSGINNDPKIKSFRELDPEVFQQKSQNIRQAEPDDRFKKEDSDVEALNIPGSGGDLFKSVQGSKDESSPIPAKWTVMVYFNGNGDLEKDMEKNMASLEKAGSDGNINFVAQIARMSKKGEAQRVHLKKPSWMGLKNNSEVMDNLGPTNMAHPQSLKDFITWGMKKFPAERYALIMNGHGMGFVGSMPDELSKDFMSTPEFESAVKVATKEAGRKIDVLGFDSCLMATAETAYSAKDAANFMIASQEVVIAGNWDYEKFGNEMKEKAGGQGLSVGDALEAIVKSQYNNRLLTSSIIDLRRMPEFADKLKDFSHRLLSTTEPDYRIRSCFRKAQHYCQRHIIASASNGGNINTKPMDQLRDVASVALHIITDDNIGDIELKKSALNLARFTSEKAVIFEMHRKKYGLDQSKGMSIYAPTSEAEGFADYYNKISLSEDTGWGKVVEKFGT